MFSVPVTDLRPKGPILLKEKQSFQHIYDSRIPKNYPDIGKVGSHYSAFLQPLLLVGLLKSLVFLILMV